MMTDFDEEFDVPFEWVVAEIARDVDGRVTVEVPGILRDQAFKVAVEDYVTGLAQSVPESERIADVFRLVVTPEGDHVQVQMLDAGFSIGLHPQAFGLPPISSEGGDDDE